MCKLFVFPILLEVYALSSAQTFSPCVEEAFYAITLSAVGFVACIMRPVCKGKSLSPGSERKYGFGGVGGWGMDTALCVLHDLPYGGGGSACNPESGMRCGNSCSFRKLSFSLQSISVYLKRVSRRPKPGSPTVSENHVYMLVKIPCHAQ